ncbi:hypothetical protein [Sphingobacterium psychroaquaticum]|uniref:HTH domain-containing protein n=1 Tax=Sphingobacterium psychroaquaticum TaxID=561061 RepID=A0A1X7KXI6_9SPHI|nr:hypothetical protein [Sphingobacterium psychroaquaticum]SMG46328.1 hypothetical protein SAMN05660862_3292 [Sphingobacterium psychroaquaticum]
MKVFIYIERINWLDELIQQRRTGTPKELARRFGISCSRLYRIIDYMKGMGAPIAYDRKLRTYYYTSLYSIQIKIEVQELNDAESEKILGGSCFLSKGRSLLFLCAERK